MEEREIYSTDPPIYPAFQSSVFTHLTEIIVVLMRKLYISYNPAIFLYIVD